jgi:hypothetical protein
VVENTTQPEEELGCWAQAHGIDVDGTASVQGPGHLQKIKHAEQVWDLDLQQRSKEGWTLRTIAEEERSQAAGEAAPGAKGLLLGGTVT